MLIDLHAHTQPLSHDSSLTPDELIAAAKEAGLDGVCLTEHDFFWDQDEVRRLARRHGFLVIPGVEVNTENGHILVFGLDEYVYGMHRMHELAALVEKAGGAMVAGHPYRRQLPFELRHEGDWSEALEAAARNPAYGHVNAIETLNGRGTIRENQFSQALSEILGLSAAAGSDSHDLKDVGRCATEFEVTITGLEDLIAALKSGWFRPVELRGSGE
jgi:predicted metal-dependent phosphoesterase TrpH